MLRAGQGDGLAERHRAEAAWTEALIHIVDGNVREPAALWPTRCRWSSADQRALAVGASRRRRRRALAGGHLVESPTRRTSPPARSPSSIVATSRTPSQLVAAGIAVR